MFVKFSLRDLKYIEVEIIINLTEKFNAKICRTATKIPNSAKSVKYETPK